MRVIVYVRDYCCPDRIQSFMLEFQRPANANCTAMEADPNVRPHFFKDDGIWQGADPVDVVPSYARPGEPF